MKSDGLLKTYVAIVATTILAALTVLFLSGHLELQVLALVATSILGFALVSDLFMRLRARAILRAVYAQRLGPLTKASTRAAMLRFWVWPVEKSVSCEEEEGESSNTTTTTEDDVPL